MRNKIVLTVFFFIASLFSRPVLADDVKITTYYPSPYGSYTNLESTGDTYLATEDGGVGISTKTLTSTAKLEVKGYVRLKDPSLPVSVGNVLVDRGLVDRGVGVGVWEAPPAKGSLRGSGAADYLANWANWIQLTTFNVVEKNGNLGISALNPQSRVSVGGNGVANAALFGTIAGSSDYGIRGQGDAYGIWAEGKTYGVYGEAPNFGIYGDQKTGSMPEGLTGEGHHGVHGEGSSFGVYGKARGPLPRAGVYGKNLNANGYGVYCEGSFCGGNRIWTNTSDARLKTAIETIPHPIEKVQGLRGVQFQWKDGGQKDMGFIAQEVLKVAPEAVDKGPEGYYTLKQSELTAIFVEAMKAQQKELEELQKELEVIKQKRGEVHPS